MLERISQFLYLAQNKRGAHELMEGHKVLSLACAPNFIVSMSPDTFHGSEYRPWHDLEWTQTCSTDKAFGRRLAVWNARFALPLPLMAREWTLTHAHYGHSL